MPSASPHNDYDAILVVSFGGPEGMDDVMPFLQNVISGRNVSRERMLEVASHYELFGGVSPINEHNRSLIAALQTELDANGPRLPIYFGNRNWHPLLRDTIATMREDGVKSALAFVTSAYSSYSSCRQYRENIAAARESVGEGAPRIEKLRAFFNHPGFINANVQNIRRELDHFDEDRRQSVPVIFTAHSIPESMAVNCDYEKQLKETGRIIAEKLGTAHWHLVFQSRSGPPTQPWLGPDVCDFLKEFEADGVKNVVLAPIGFTSDHMEVIYDLDLRARELCEHIGLTMRRAATVGTDPGFIKMIRELVMERINPQTPQRFEGSMAPLAQCGSDCCPAPTPPSS